MFESKTQSINPFSSRKTVTAGGASDLTTSSGDASNRFVNLFSQAPATSTNNAFNNLYYGFWKHISDKDQNIILKLFAEYTKPSFSPLASSEVKQTSLNKLQESINQAMPSAMPYGDRDNTNLLKYKVLLGECGSNNPNVDNAYDRDKAMKAVIALLSDLKKSNSLDRLSAEQTSSPINIPFRNNPIEIKKNILQQIYGPNDVDKRKLLKYVKDFKELPYFDQSDIVYSILSKSKTDNEQIKFDKIVALASILHPFFKLCTAENNSYFSLDNKLHTLITPYFFTHPFEIHEVKPRFADTNKFDEQTAEALGEIILDILSLGIDQLDAWVHLHIKYALPKNKLIDRFDKLGLAYFTKSLPHIFENITQGYFTNHRCELTAMLINQFRKMNHNSGQSVLNGDFYIKSIVAAINKGYLLITEDNIADYSMWFLQKGVWTLSDKLVNYDYAIDNDNIIPQTLAQDPLSQYPSQFNAFHPNLVQYFLHNKKAENENRNKALLTIALHHTIFSKLNENDKIKFSDYVLNYIEQDIVFKAVSKLIDKNENDKSLFVKLLIIHVTNLIKKKTIFANYFFKPNRGSDHCWNSDQLQQQQELANGVYITSDMRYYQVIDGKINELKLKTPMENIPDYPDNQQLADNELSTFFLNYTTNTNVSKQGNNLLVLLNKDSMPSLPQDLQLLMLINNLNYRDWCNPYRVSKLDSNGLLEQSNLKNGVYATTDKKFYQVIDKNIYPLTLENAAQNMQMPRDGQLLPYSKCITLFEDYTYFDKSQLTKYAKYFDSLPYEKQSDFVHNILTYAKTYEYTSKLSIRIAVEILHAFFKSCRSGNEINFRGDKNLHPLINAGILSRLLYNLQLKEMPPPPDTYYSNITYFRNQYEREIFRNLSEIILDILNISIDSTTQEDNNMRENFIRCYIEWKLPAEELLDMFDTRGLIHFGKSLPFIFQNINQGYFEAYKIKLTDMLTIQFRMRNDNSDKHFLGLCSKDGRSYSPYLASIVEAINKNHMLVTKINLNYYVYFLQQYTYFPPNGEVNSKLNAVIQNRDGYTIGNIKKILAEKNPSNYPEFDDYPQNLVQYFLHNKNINSPKNSNWKKDLLAISLDNDVFSKLNENDKIKFFDYALNYIEHNIVFKAVSKLIDENENDKSLFVNLLIIHVESSKNIYKMWENRYYTITSKLSDHTNTTLPNGVYYYCQTSEEAEYYQVIGGKAHRLILKDSVKSVQEIKNETSLPDNEFSKLFINYKEKTNYNNRYNNLLVLSNKDNMPSLPRE